MEQMTAETKTNRARKRKRSGPGRPALSDRERRDTTVRVRLDPPTHKLWVRKAKRAGLTLSELMRAAVECYEPE